MFKKIKKFVYKIYPSVFLIVTLALFLSISYKIFVVFRNVRLFENNLLSLIILVIVYSAIYLFLIDLYYKIFKFTLMKSSISKEEFSNLWKRRRKIAQELEKGRKNKTILYGSKKFKEKDDEFEKIGKLLDEKAISFKSWFEFFVFSVYYGFAQGLLIWAIKNSTKYFNEATKNFFSFDKMGLGFRWYKLKNGYCQISSFVYPYRKPTGK